jgi:F-type H+-transporting ATPase subunit epsilon
MPISVKIITPTGVVLERDVDSLIIDTTMGEVQILPEHRPLIAKVEVGSARLISGSSEYDIAVSTGLLQFENNNAVVLVGEAINVASDDRISKEIADAESSAQSILDEIHRQGVLEQEELDSLAAKIRAKINKNLEHKQKFG